MEEQNKHAGVPVWKSYFWEGNLAFNVHTCSRVFDRAGAPQGTASVISATISHLLRQLLLSRPRLALSGVKLVFGYIVWLFRGIRNCSTLKECQLHFKEHKLLFPDVSLNYPLILIFSHSESTFSFKVSNFLELHSLGCIALYEASADDLMGSCPERGPASRVKAVRNQLDKAFGEPWTVLN